MKKILSMLLILLVLVGCMPTHDTAVEIQFKEDFSGELVLKVELETEYLEDPVDEIEATITKIVEELDQFKEGTLKTKSTSKSLDFTYTESFKDLEDLSAVLTRIYDEKIEITMDETETIFRSEKHLDGFYFDAKEFTNPIYDVIEKEELFKENSKEARANQEGYSFVDVYMEGELFSPYDDFSGEDYRNINKDTLFIKVIDSNTVNLLNVIEASEDLDLEELETYYQTKYKDRSLSANSKAKMIIEKDIKTNSLSISMDNVRIEDVEDLQYEIFNRFIEIASDSMNENQTSGRFDIVIYDMGHTFEFEEIILEREVNIDISGYKIINVDDEPFHENAYYDFDINGDFLTFEEDADFTITLEESNFFASNNIIMYAVYGVVGLLILVALFFVFKNISKNNKNKTKQVGSVIEEREVQETTEQVEEQADLKKNKIIQKNDDYKFIKEVQKSIFNVNALRHTAIMLLTLLVIVIIATALRGVVLGNEANELLSMSDMDLFDYGYTAPNIFETFKLMFGWISTGGLSVNMSTGLGDMFTNFNVNFSAYANPLLFSVLVPLLGTFISLKAFTYENLKERNRQLLSGALWYGVIILVLSYLPLMMMSEINEYMSLSADVTGNSMSVGLVMLPLYLIITYIIISWKRYFSTLEIKVTRVFYEGFVKFLTLFSLSVIAAFVITVVKDQYPFVTIINVAGIVMTLASGMTFKSTTMLEYQEFGIMGASEYTLLIGLAIVVYILIALFNLKKIYKRSNLVNKNIFTIVYTLAFTVPIYLFGAMSGIMVSTQLGNIAMTMNTASMIVSFMITLLIVFVRVQMIQGEHPQEHEVLNEENLAHELVQAPTPIHEEVVSEESVQEDVIEEKVVEEALVQAEVVAEAVQEEVPVQTEVVVEVVQEEVAQEAAVQTEVVEVEVVAESQTTPIEDDGIVKTRPMSGRRHRRRK